MGNIFGKKYFSSIKKVFRFNLLSAKSTIPIQTLFLTTVSLTWMEDSQSNLSQPAAILWVYSADFKHNGAKNTIDRSPDFLKMSGTFYTFSEVLNIRPAINQIVITDTIKPTAKLTLKNISPKVMLQL